MNPTTHLVPIKHKSDQNQVANREVSELFPPPDFVVSRFQNGATASFFTDFYWDWSPYHPRERVTRLNFVKWCGPDPTPAERIHIRDIQFLAYLLIWKRDGAPLSHGSLQHYIGTLNELASYCNQNNRRIKDVLREPELQAQFYSKLSGVRCKYMAALITHLSDLGEKQCGFNCVRGNGWKYLKTRIIEHNGLVEQHPPIPTRILSELLLNLKQEIEDFGEVAERLLSLFKVCAEDPSLGRAKGRIAGSNTSKCAKKADQSFPNLISQYELNSYFSAKNLPLRIHSLPRALKEVQLVASLLIKAYSGMRNSESMFLPFNCLEIVPRTLDHRYLLRGTTSKLNHGRPKIAKWVTSVEVRSAVLLSQRIATCIYGVTDGPSVDELNGSDKYPLFVAASYAQLGRSPKPATLNDVYVPSALGLVGYPELSRRIIPTVREDDLAELENIDPFRDWRRNKKFEVNKPWPLTSHQLRRSLALYASRSGLVSLPTLRRQLKHITEEMSRYYAKGSQTASTIIRNDKRHFGTEYQQAQTESQALAYIKNVLLSEEKLFGAHGVWADRHLRAQPGRPIDRRDTLKRFERGELAYRETIFGGCTNVGPCEKRVFQWTSACIDCKHSVGKPSKLNTIIKAQESLVSSLPPDSVEWSIENGDLAALKSLKNRVGA